MRNCRILILCVILVVAGCSSKQFALSDESAVAKLMSTHYVANLQKQVPAKFVCFVVGTTDSERDLYLGEDHPDHTVHLRTCRVTSDGRVWVNADDTLLEESWVVVD